MSTQCRSSATAGSPAGKACARCVSTFCASPISSAPCVKAPPGGRNASPIAERIHRLASESAPPPAPRAPPPPPPRGTACRRHLRRERVCEPPGPESAERYSAVNEKIGEIDEVGTIEDQEEEAGAARHRLADRQRRHQGAPLRRGRADHRGERGDDRHVCDGEPEPEAMGEMRRVGETEDPPDAVQRVDRSVREKEEKRPHGKERPREHAIDGAQQGVEAWVSRWVWR